MKKDNDASDERTGCTTALGRAVVTCLMLALVCYVALLLIGRTEGFHQIAKDHVSNLLELDVDIEHSEINPSLALLLRNVSYSTDEMDGAGASVDSLLLRYRLRFVPWPRLSVKHVELEGLRLDFVRRSGDVYEPLQLSPIHAMIFESLELPLDGFGAAEDSLIEIMESEVCWMISAGLIRWLAEDGVVLREAAELNLEISPFETSSTSFSYIDMKMRYREGVRAYEDLSLQKVILHRNPD